MDVLERVRTVVGDKAENLILLYNAFLTALDNNDIRQKLSNLDFQNVSEFKDLREQGRIFKEELLKLLLDKYPFSHPIHKALLL